MPITERDVRAVTRALDDVLQRYQNVLDADSVPDEERRKLRAELESEMADAKASARLTKGSKVNVTRLNEKIVSVRSVLNAGKDAGGKISGPSKNMSAAKVVSSKVSILSQPDSPTSPKVIGEKQSEARSGREGTSLETRSIARTTASSTRSVVAKRNALERAQLEEEQKICDEMADAEKEARRLQ